MASQMERPSGNPLYVILGIGAGWFGGALVGRDALANPESTFARIPPFLVGLGLIFLGLLIENAYRPVVQSASRNAGPKAAREFLNHAVAFRTAFVIAAIGFWYAVRGVLWALGGVALVMVVLGSVHAMNTARMQR